MSHPHTEPALHQTPFKKFHESHGAKFVEFAGWEMPIHYGSIIDEHKQCRESGALFDVSHMGRVKISGRHARKYLETLLTRKVSDMEPKTCRYSMVCNPSGGVLDDVLVYRFEEHWLLVVNASNREKLLAHFEAVKQDGSFVVEVEDQTLKTAMVAVQGPRVMEMIGKFSSEVPTLGYYTFCQKNLMVLKMTISRTGYTGEDGVEVILGAGMAEMAVKLLLKDAQTVKPAGLGARDSLRLEAGMPLYGHELDEETDPLSAGLKFAVSLDKDQSGDGPEVPRFIGQDALEKIAADGPSRQLIGLKLDGKRTPRQGAVVQTGDGQSGAVTSGCFSPTLGYPIALAYVPRGSAAVGDTVGVVLGRNTLDAEVVKRPFYKRS
ncbi:MAG: glycine cleavage system aminomethyltransferase GcvT [Planctomycetes bacterium]|jgi:aminomethyltransferase|nr:glycine cleavage system aminomethyltransferase GcvT [Planctomycetota bacterium]